MLLGVDQHETLDEPLPVPAAGRDRARRVAARRGASFLAGHDWATGATSTRRAARAARATGQRRDASRAALFTDFLWAFEITAVLLVIAVVGGVVLARRSGHRPVADRERQTCDAAQPAPRPLGARSERDDRGRRDHADLLPDRSRRCSSRSARSALLVRRNTLVMFMCIELMLNAVNLTFVDVRQGARRHRRPGDRVLHARGRRGRGRGRAWRSSWPSSGAVADVTADDVRPPRGLTS